MYLAVSEQYFLWAIGISLLGIGVPLAFLTVTTDQQFKNLMSLLKGEKTIPYECDLYKSIGRTGYTIWSIIVLPIALVIWTVAYGAFFGSILFGLLGLAIMFFQWLF